MRSRNLAKAKDNDAREVLPEHVEHESSGPSPDTLLASRRFAEAASRELFNAAGEDELLKGIADLFLEGYDYIYKKYSDAISSMPQTSAQAYFLACNAYEKAHKTNKQAGCLRDFIKKFNKQQQAGEYIVQAYAKQAVISENSTKNKDEILKAYKRVRDEYLSRKLPGGTPAAAFAAKADFLIMKEKFKPFQRMELKLGGNPLPRDARIGLEYP
jgi:hypothetical protein